MCNVRDNQSIKFKSSYNAILLLKQGHSETANMAKYSYGFVFGPWSMNLSTKFHPINYVASAEPC